MILKLPRGILGSTGNLPVVLGSLPSTSVVGKLPTTAGWQLALPNPQSSAAEAAT